MRVESLEEEDLGEPEAPLYQKWVEAPRWLIAIVGIAYATGFLIVSTYLDSYGIRNTGGDFLRLKYLEVGFYFLCSCGSGIFLGISLIQLWYTPKRRHYVKLPESIEEGKKTSPSIKAQQHNIQARIQTLIRSIIWISVLLVVYLILGFAPPDAAPHDVHWLSLLLFGAFAFSALSVRYLRPSSHKNSWRYYVPIYLMIIYLEHDSFTKFSLRNEALFDGLLLCWPVSVQLLKWAWPRVREKRILRRYLNLSASFYALIAFAISPMYAHLATRFGLLKLSAAFASIVLLSSVISGWILPRWYRRARTAKYPRGPRRWQAVVLTGFVAASLLTYGLALIWPFRGKLLEIARFRGLFLLGLVYVLGYLIFRTLNQRREINKAEHKLYMTTRIVLGVATYYLAVLTFAYTVYPYMSAAKGGGYYRDVERVSLTVPYYAGFLPTNLLCHPSSGGFASSDSFVILDSNDATISVASPLEPKVADGPNAIDGPQCRGIESWTNSLCRPKVYEIPLRDVIRIENRPDPLPHCHDQ